MGFSVSGSFAILVLASLVAFGMLYSAGANSFERVSGATHATQEDSLDRQNTAICLTDLETNGGGNWLWVNTTNLGSTVLDVAATDVFIDGEYWGVEDAQRVRVDGDPNTDLWRPGSVLTLRFQTGEEPDRVKVVTEHGISDWEPYPVDGCDVDSGTGGGGGGGGSGGSGGDDNTTTQPEFVSVTAEVTAEHQNHGVEEVTFTWETTDTADLAFRIYDGNGNVVGSVEITNAGTSGTQVVSVTNGANSGGSREPRPIVVEAEIFDTGETCSQTISNGDGNGPFQLC